LLNGCTGSDAPTAAAPASMIVGAPNSPMPEAAEESPSLI
jgi:hypothetical protein